ncbi:hypothetical protein VCHA42O253_110001 [Vibrio chagasii]|nr:hypothetical protein VCHA42O253_110001 [Vibrio chagasii]
MAGTHQLNKERGKNALVERLTLKQPEHIVLPVLFKTSNLMVLWLSTKQ